MTDERIPRDQQADLLARDCQGQERKKNNMKQLLAQVVFNRPIGVAVLAAILLAGCVPGEATVSVKSSELAKAVAGRIGWAEVTLAVSNVYENVELSVYPKSALDACGLLGDGVVADGVLGPTNRLSDVLASVANQFNACLPDFLCRDESVRLSSSVVGTNAVISVAAKLKVPIGKAAVLEAANLPRVMQFAIPENRWALEAARLPAAHRLHVVAKLLDSCLQARGYVQPKEDAPKKPGAPPSLYLGMMLDSLVNIAVVDTIYINQAADDASPYVLKSVDVTHNSADYSHLWLSGGGLMSAWERSLREQLVPTNATEVVFWDDEHSGHGMSCLYAKTTCRIAESEFLSFAESKNYRLATNSFENVGSQKFEKGEFRMPTEGAVNFISYSDIQNNGGGIHLIYDRDKQILRGFYSHH